jgi:hypothetical protein
MASKKRTAKPPPVPVPAKGKAKKTSTARKPLKKAAPGLGPGPHHSSTYRRK